MQKLFMSYYARKYFNTLNVGNINRKGKHIQ